MGKRQRVLVIDDEEAICSFLRIFFEEEGYEVSTSLAAEDGVKAALKERPDIVFVDLNIPKMGGIEVLRQIKKSDENTVVVVITGFGTIEGARSAMNLGAYDYITKPLDIDFIKEVVTGAASSARQKAAGNQ
ncbi:MAG: response regulator [Deltaproteobacteria bacterium]|nr:response regulator [Deltaproteobacteria bacterium]